MNSEIAAIAQAGHGHEVYVEEALLKMTRLYRSKQHEH